MTCPQCGGEYRDGFTQCADCDGPLVAVTESSMPEVEEPDPDRGLVSVLETGNPAEMAFAESLLLEAGIDYTKQGDRVQDLFGIGRLGGFNVLTGPAKLLVAEQDAEAARHLLRDQPPAPLPLEEDAEIESEPDAEAD
jgi:hypothetical protein